MQIRHLIAGVALALVATSASAVDFSGTFGNDASKASFFFTVKTPSIVTITSTGFAGGGFDPVLSLYDNTGFGIDFNDDQAEGVSDSELVTNLGAGRYTVFLTQYDNFGPASLDLPFAFDGQPNFRGGFVDFNGSQRTGNWALSIDGAFKAGAVPEPASWAMLLAGFALVGGVMRRRGVTTIAA